MGNSSSLKSDVKVSKLLSCDDQGKTHPVCSSSSRMPITSLAKETSSFQLFRGKGHIQKMFVKLNNMRKSATLTDVVIQCGCQDFHCHAIVLTVRSTFFAQLFAKNWKDNVAFFSYTVTSFTASIVESFMHFMYTGCIDVPASQFNEYVAAAKLWDLSAIFEPKKLVVRRSVQPFMSFITVPSSEDVPSSSTFLREKDFESSVQSRLAKLYRSGLSMPRYNVILCTSDGMEIPCHKDLVASFSEYFLAMLSSNAFTESYQDKVVLQDVDYATLRCIVEYLYTGEIILLLDNAQSVAIASKWLLVDEQLINAAEIYLVDRVNAENCIEWLQFANYYLMNKLQTAAGNWAYQYLDKVTKARSFVSYTEAVVSEYLSSDELNVSSELQVFEAVLRWSAQRSTDEMQSLFQSCVRLTLMSSSELTSAIEMLNHENSQHIQIKPNLVAARDKAKSTTFETRLRDSKQHQRDCMEKTTLVIQKILPVQKSTYCLAIFRVKDFSENMTPVQRSPNLSLEYSCLFSTGVPFSWKPKCERYDGFSVTVFDNRLYITGGSYFVDRGKPTFNYRLVASTTTLIYDPSPPHSWRQGPELLTGRYSHQSVVVDDVLYVLGGYAADGSWIDKVESLKLFKNKWVHETRIPTDSPEMACTVWKDKIFVFNKPSSSSSAILRRYATNTKQWLTTIVLSVPKTVQANDFRRFWDAFVMQNKIYLFSETDRDQLVSVYDPSDGTWKPNLQENAPLGSYTPIVHSDHVVVLGALDETQKHRLRTTYYRKYRRLVSTETSLTVKHADLWKPAIDQVPVARRNRFIRTKHSELRATASTRPKDPSLRGHTVQVYIRKEF